MRTHPYAALTLFVLGFALAGTLAAQAADVSREEYVARVEPICKRNTEADERILHGVRDEVRANKLKPAAAKFTRAAAALRNALRELEAVPRPAADEAILAKWFKDIAAEVTLFERTAAKLRMGERVGAEKMSIHLTTAVNRANNDVVPFEFRYCHANPAKFT